MKINRFALLALLTLAGSVPAFSAATFTPTGVIEMVPTSMSDDASIVVGTGFFGFQIFTIPKRPARRLSVTAAAAVYRNLG